RVVVPQAPDAVLLGTAMAAAVAGNLYPDLAHAGGAMASTGQERRPNPALRDLYNRDYRRFLALYRHRAELESIE
ncbi:MAG: ribulokinase, partial [Sinorhizobium fredii]|nr:ribulokinase [Sinorhizobium fredii]